MRFTPTSVPPLDDSPATGRARPDQHPEFSEQALAALLAALRARTSHHPDNPGLIACWPGVREARMAAACGELRRRGHPVFRVSIPGVKPGTTRHSWAVAAATDEPATP
jgi:hypothetical protein